MAKPTKPLTMHSTPAERQAAMNESNRRAVASGHGNPYHDGKGKFTTSGQAVIVRGKNDAGDVRAVLVKNVGGKHAHQRAVEITRSVKGFYPSSSSFADAASGRSLGGHAASLKPGKTLVDHFSETKALTVARRTEAYNKDQRFATFVPQFPKKGK